MSNNPKQFYLDFVYDDYIKSHSSYAYIITILDYIDWSIVPKILNHPAQAG
ncbi:hypothetical protein JCM30566_19740 [Marinitoga arctica]